jgi:NhaP-type Na+/H+ or K+/H+ antiporter
LSEVLPARLRIIVVAGALPIAAVFTLLAAGALSKLWADYKDSSDATYLTVGGIAGAVALALICLVWYVLRDADGRTRFLSVAAGLLLSVAGGLALVALPSGPPDFPESAPRTGEPPVATPSIATPSLAR